MGMVERPRGTVHTCSGGVGLFIHGSSLLVVWGVDEDMSTS